MNNFGCRAVPRTAADALVGLRFECFGEPNQSAAASPRFVVTGISIGEDAPSPQLVGAAVLMKQPANKLRGLGLSSYETGHNSMRRIGHNALYGKPITNIVIVNEGTPMLEIAKAFVAEPGRGSNRYRDPTNQALLALA